jgi:hypothetical protein
MIKNRLRLRITRGFSSRLGGPRHLLPGVPPTSQHVSLSPSMALRDIANTMHIATQPEKPPHVAPAASTSAPCSSTTEDLLPALDISPFLQDPNSDAAQQLAARIADSLKSTGCLVVSAAAGQLIACM